MVNINNYNMLNNKLLKKYMFIKLNNIISTKTMFLIWNYLAEIM